MFDDETKGDDCDICGKEMPPNVFSGLFGVHPECIEAEERQSLENVISVCQVSQSVVDWSVGFHYNRATLYARVQGSVSPDE
jgi:hypothetical protein